MQFPEGEFAIEIQRDETLISSPRYTGCSGHDPNVPGLFRKRRVEMLSRFISFHSLGAIGIGKLRNGFPSDFARRIRSHLGEGGYLRGHVILEV